MAAVTEHTARKGRPCGVDTCTRSIEPGQRYLRHVAFPGDEGYEEGTRPWVIEECAACCARWEALAQVLAQQLVDPDGADQHRRVTTCYGSDS
jgi:hypothetical protein